MNNIEFVKRLQNIVDNYKTTYMWGVFGSVVDESIISQKSKQYPSWYTSNRQAYLRKLIGKGYFAFDCVNVIKAILWGWNGDKSKTYGGAKYASNGVPDIGADTMITKCSSISTDFSKVEIGEVVWLKGHIGVYIGNGKVIECTPSFDNGVQITACGNIGIISGLNTRKWTSHGKLPYISYVKEDVVIKNEEDNMFKVGNLTIVNEKEYQKSAITKAVEQGIITGDGVKLDASEVINKGDFCVLMEKMGFLSK
ncbi:MAG: hypothetical protein ACK5LY_04015 [Lachnospirales bacterium]